MRAPTTGNNRAARSPPPATNRDQAADLNLARPAAVVLLLLVAACSPGGGKADGALPLRRVETIALPGDTSRFDYTSLDSDRAELFIAHLGQGAVLAVDVHNGRVTATIPAPGVHGVLAVPALDRAYASASANNEELGIDAQTLAIVSRAPTGGTPDGISYDPDDQRIFVSDETGADLTVLDARTGTRLGTVKLAGQAGNNVYDPTSRSVLVADQSHNTLDVINPTTLAVTARHPLPGCDHDHGLAVDPAVHRAFVACDDNNQLLTVDLASFAVTERTATGSGPDVLAIDPTLHRLYVAAESGDWTVLDIGGKPQVLARRHLAKGAHTFAIDAHSHDLYVPLADVGGHPVLAIYQPT